MTKLSDPREGVAAMRNAQRSWQRLWVGETRALGRHGWRPAANVYEVEGGAVVRVEAAGLEPGDFRVALRQHRLIVSGERRVSAPPSAVRCYRVEMASGSFRLEVPLPWPVDATGARLDYAAGILSIYLPRG